MKKITAFISFLCFGVNGFAQNISTAGNGLYKPTSSSVALSDGSALTTSAVVLDFGTSTGGSFKIKKGSANYLFLANAGFLGLGNASPTEQLDVTGNIRFSGALMPNNSAGTSGQVLTSAGAGNSPTWSTVTGSNIASADLTANGNRITDFSGYRLWFKNATNTTMTGTAANTFWFGLYSSHVSGGPAPATHQDNAVVNITTEKSWGNSNGQALAMSVANATDRNGFTFYNYSNVQGSIIPTLATYGNSARTNGDAGYSHYAYAKNAATPYPVIEWVASDYSTSGALTQRPLWLVRNGSDVKLRMDNTGTLNLLTSGTTSFTAENGIKLNPDGNSIFANGNIGIGTSTPGSKLEIATPSGATENVILNIKDVSQTYNPNRLGHTAPILPTIGLDANVGLTWHNDGGGAGLGLGLVASQRMVAYAVSTADQKSFMVNDAGNNMANFSLEFKNVGPNFSNPNNYWHYKPSSSTIVAWNKTLNLGSAGGAVRIYSDGGNPNKVADISIYDSKIGIGTETPNANAKLDVNGNIYTNGRMGIGTTNFTDAGYRLYVETGIRTRKVKVDQAVWPDYVFENDYPLLSLAGVESFIKKNKHLPGVPNESEVKKEGVDLGEMQAVLLKKIEELTLYTIEQEKRLNELTRELLLLKEGNQKRSQDNK